MKSTEEKIMEIQKYVRENHLRVTNEEVRELFNDREKNKNKILKTQLALVLNVTTNIYHNHSKLFEEVFSDGLYGLTRAVETYNPEHKGTFSTYAKTAIKHTIYENLNSHKMIREPSSNRRGIEVPTARVFSDYIREGEDGELEITDRIEGIIDDTNLNTNEVQLRQFIIDALGSERKGNIISDSLGLCLDKKKTYGEIGKELNISKQRVSQVYLKEMDKLKDNEIFKKKLREYYKL